MTRFSRAPLYRRHRFPADVIARAVWLYFRFPLSLRMVEDMLVARRDCATKVQTISNANTWLKQLEEPAWVYGYGAATAQLG